MDLTEYLKDWPPDEAPNVRCFTGDDGKQKVQIRVCIDSFNGVLQFDADGRPDGQRPHDKDFYLDHLEEKLAHVPGGDFHLTHAQCKRLFDESGMVYHRYVVMLQLGDYDRVMRDTTRNMRLFEFVNRHALKEEDRNHQECWWPYILRIHYTAKAMKELGQGRFDTALAAVLECRKRIEGLAPQENQIFQHESQRSLEALDDMEQQIRKRKPLTDVEKLEHQKNKAIEEQRYEDAARLRDKIARLSKDSLGDAANSESPEDSGSPAGEAGPEDTAPGESGEQPAPKPRRRIP
ncbi:MAG: UvrB/UvrC motif-containing protein [Planctomycetes bacterium]|nr:UvrB/UvrC motif-containing protein [Planctomycetota bacterium]